MDNIFRGAPAAAGGATPGSQQQRLGGSIVAQTEVDRGLKLVDHQRLLDEPVDVVIRLVLLRRRRRALRARLLLARRADCFSMMVHCSSSDW